MSGLFVTGCQTLTGGRPAPELRQSNLPDVTTGQKFVYDDGTTLTALLVERDKIFWRASNGSIRESGRNPFVPYYNWQTSTRRARGWIDGSGDDLWPLQVDKSADFVLTRDVANNDGSDKKRYRQHWQCEVSHTETITWRQQPWPVFVVECNQQSRGFWRETARHYYSPQLGTDLVIEQIFRRRATVRKELVSVEFDTSILPQTEQRSLIETVQRTLNGIRNGAEKTAAWKSASLPVSVQIQVGAGFRDPAGRDCRNYVGTFFVGARKITNNRAGCLDQSGRWIPYTQKGA